jgi:hypothetical protein
LCGIGDAGVAHIAKIKGLEKLNLFDNSNLSKGVKHIANLTVKDLDLSSCNINDDAIAYILQIKGLEKLNLNNNRITGDGILSIHESLGGLTEFNLSEKKLTFEQAEDLFKKSFKNTGFTINIAANPLDVSGSVFSKALSKMSNISKLHLSHNLFSGDDWKEIFKILPKMEHLKQLNINESRINNEGAIALSGLKNITDLNLDFNSIGDQGAIALSKTEAPLKNLSLKSNYIYQEGARALSLMNPETVVNLEGNYTDRSDPSAPRKKWKFSWPFKICRGGSCINVSTP